MEAARDSCTLTPALSQRERELAVAAAPASDSSGIRSFVSRIRGLNHLSLPPLQFGVPAPRGPGLIDVGLQDIVPVWG